MNESLKKECGCHFRSYRLILMDIQMPVMDGFESSKIIVNKLKQLNQNGILNPSANEDNALSHVVALTSFTQDITQKCFNVGMREMTNKPLRFKKLCELMARHFFRISEERIAELLLH